MDRPSRRPLALALLACTALQAHARAPEPAPPQMPGVVHHAIGPLRLTSLFDGTVALPQTLLSGIEPDRVTRLLADGYVPGDGNGVQTAVNAFLVRSGQELVLVDAGAADCFGPGLGQIPVHLRAAGYAPEQIDHVLLTHGHPDHLCGLRDSQGQATYPNATVWLSEADAAHWLDPAREAAAPEQARATFAMARRAIEPYLAGERFRRFRPGDELPIGARALDSHGHTPGHVSYLFGEGDNSLLAWGDVLHFHAVQFAQPQASVEFDSDRTAAISARKAMLEQASAGRWWVAGAHLPFPGVGHVLKEGSADRAYRWVPSEYGPIPHQD
jgi:glyoxylase-like metal-dependent hydrolase (beta-lactamase superfamily II)